MDRRVEPGDTAKQLPTVRASHFTIGYLSQRFI